MSTTEPAAENPFPRRWIALLFIALAQLMVILDATIVNIALPSAQKALEISDGNRQWVITAYTLAFGGLLLFGGRVGDLIGRKRTFLIGLVGFAGASALGGAAQTEGLLLGARALQGVFGALLAPSALSLLAVTFTTPKERAKAFGIYGAIAGGGSALGLILGGVLTEYLNWRWALYVNVPIAILGFIGGMSFIKEPARRHRAHLDIPGVVLVTAGLISLVYGFTRAESEGWGEGGVIGLFVAAAVLLVAFAVFEGLTKHPLLPLRVVVNRTRGGAYLAVGLAVIGMFGLFLFMTYYLQTIKGYSPVRSGLAFLPMTAAMITGSTQISARLMNRVPPRALMVPGLLLAAGGAGLLTQLEVGSAYTHLLLPAELMLGLGLGVTFMPAMNLATAGVEPHDAGVASAMVNTSQQVGGSIGTALLNTIAATATTNYLAEHATGTPSPQLAAIGLVHGFNVALWWAVGVLVLAAFFVAVLINNKGRGRHVVSKADDSAVPAEITLDKTMPVRELVSVSARNESYENGGIGENGGPSAVTRATSPVAVMASTTAGGGGDAGAPGGFGQGSSGFGGSSGSAGSDGLNGLSGPSASTGSGGTGGTGLAGGTGPRIRGFVRAGEGVPIAGAALTLIDLGGHQVGRAGAESDGSYSLAVPGTGTYMLIAASDGHQPQVATVVVGDESLSYDLTLAGTSGVDGVVRSAATGLPVPGAMVVVTDVRGEVVSSATTGEDGAFSFDELVPGGYVIAVSAGGHRPCAVPAEVAGQGTTRCDIELQVGARVQGVIRGGVADLPLADARVTLVGPAGDVVATATTGHDGEYAFMDLDPGQYTVIASGYPPVAAALTLDGAGESGFGLTLGHPTDA